jgi:PAS domain S-box-containing protein
MEPNQQRIARRAVWLARLVAIGVLLLAVVVLAGWALDNPLLTGALPGQVAMKANTAVGFGLTALALWLLVGRAAPPRWQWVALGCALVVTALGAVSLIEYLLEANLGIDQLLFREPAGAFGTSHPGRMAPLTAVCLVLLGTALGCMTRPRLVLTAQPLAVLAAVIGLLNLIGYLYGAEGFYKLGPYTPMAPPTAAAFLALGIGVLCARPDAGLMRSVTSGTASSLIARRLLLAAVVLPVAFNWLEMQGQRAGFYDAAFGAALAAVAGSLVVIALIWSTARRLERGDRERRQAEEEYHTILQAAIDGFWVVDSESRLLEVNEAYCRMSGYSPDELLRMHISDLEATETPDEIRQHIGRVMAKGGDRFERSHRRKDGSIFEVDISVQHLDLRSGSFICFLQDITQRKRAEKILRQANEHLEQRVRERTAELETANLALGRESRLLEQSQEAAKIGGWELDLITRELFWTEETYRIHELSPTGYTPTLETALNFYAPESRPIISAAVQAGMTEGKDWDLELELDTARQRRIWVRAVGKVQFADGRPARAYGAFQDITERERAENERRIISEIIHGSITTRNLDDFLKLVHRSISQLVYAENCYVMLHDPVDDTIHFEFWADQHDPPLAPKPLGRGFASYVLRTGLPLRLTREARKKLEEQGEAEQIGSPSASWIGAPLRTASRTIGVIVLQHYESENAYDQRDLELLSSVGDQIATAIERKRAAEALSESEGRYRVLVENAIDIIYTRDLDGNITAINKAAERITGYTRKEMLAMNIAQVVPPEYRERLAQIEAARVTGADATPYEMQFVRKDGHRITLEATTRIIEKDGVAVGVQGIARDITERRQAEERLRLQGSALEAAANAIVITSRTGTIEWVNPAFCTLTGYSAAEAVGHNPGELVKSGKHDRAFFKNLWATILDGRVWQSETINRRKDGTLYTEFQTITPVREGQGEISHFIAIKEDITERTRAEEEVRELNDNLEQRVEERTAALRESEERFRLLAETMPDAVLVGQDGRNVYANPAAARLLRAATPAALLGLDVFAIIDPARHEKARQDMQRLMVGENAPPFEEHLVRRDGSFVTVEIATCRFTWQGRPALQMIARDISERKEIEAAIQRLNADLQSHAAQLEDANRELESFAYSVSHDLRAPLRHVQGYVEMLAKATDGKLSEKAHRYMKTIADASIDMSNLIDDLLAFSRMGRTEMIETPLLLNDLVDDTVGALEMATQGRNISWKIAPLPEVYGDRSMLKQVLANLIENAVKYTRFRDPAEIEVGCAGEEDGRVVFFVRDNGAGFDMQYTHKLFGVFQRLHRADEFEGTGIGLAIVRRIIGRHGGRTWAEGAVNQGATFYFTLKPATKAITPKE